jgi:hypothetical protein
MQHIRIERKAPVRIERDRYVALPLDPRDPDILRAKHLLDLQRSSASRKGQ